MNDSGARRHHREVLECFTGPTQERVAFAVPLELALDVQTEGVVEARVVHLHGVVDDQVRRNDRVDALRVAPECLEAITHGCQVNNRGYTGEVLKHNSRRHEWYVGA